MRQTTGAVGINNQTINNNDNNYYYNYKTKTY